MLVGQHCRGITPCCSGSGGFSLHVWPCTARRQAWRQVSLPTNCWVEGEQSRDGCSDWQTRWHTYSTSWWVFLLIAHKIPLWWTSSGQQRCTLLAWWQWTLHDQPWFPYLAREAWSSPPKGSLRTWATKPWWASLGFRHWGQAAWA